MELKIEQYFQAKAGSNGFSLSRKDLTEEEVESGKYLDIINDLDIWRAGEQGRSWRANFVYPVSEKLRMVSDRSNEIGGFLEWLSFEKDISLVILEEGENFTDWKHVSQTTQQLLAEYFEIDLDELDKERRHMFAVQRVNNERFAEANRRKV